MTRRKIASFAAAVALVAPVSIGQAQESIPKPDSSGYVAANGTNYWFEIRGKGEPLILLHGGLMSSGAFGPVFTELAKTHRVIGIDLLGHGRTALGNRKFVAQDVGRDIGVVAQELGLKQVDVLGYSLGGAVALQMGFQHPTLVRRLVLLSTVYARNGWFVDMLTQQAGVSAKSADMMKETPLYQTYAAIAPRPQDFPRLLDAVGEFMRQPYDWSESVKKLRMPVMLVFGDADMVRPEHMVSFYHLLGGGLRDAGWMREHMSTNRLAVLPDVTHYETGAVPAVVAAILPFLNGRTGPPPKK